jgi:hypothetical protein
MNSQAFRIAVVVAALLMVSSAVAQSGDVLVNVPFPFLVNNRHMPAGRYLVTPAANGVLRMSDTEHTSNQLFMNAQVVESREPQPPKLVFHRYGDSYFLAEVWNGHGNIGRKLRKSKGELELASGKVPATRPGGEIAEVRPGRQ